MTETLTPNLGLDDLNTAFFADHAAVFHPFIFAAITLVILNRSEDLGAEQAITLRFEGAVIYGLRFFHLAMGPFQNFLRRGQRNFYLVKLNRSLWFCKEVKQFFHEITLSELNVYSEPLKTIVLCGMG